jgi:hypothetical protein
LDLSRSIQQNIGGKVIIRNFILVFVPEYYLVDQMEEDFREGEFMWHVQLSRKVHTEFWWRSMKKDTSENLGRDMKILLKRIIM